MIRALILLAVFASLGLAETVEITRQPGFVELVAKDTPQGASITWEPRKPFTLPLLDRMNLDMDRVCILHLQPGEYVVLLDVIDWDNRKRIKTNYVITIEGDAPEPDPDPDPDPEPIPPAPDDLTAFGKEIRQLAIASTIPAKTKLLADPCEVVASATRAGRYRSAAESRSDLAKLTLKVVKEWPEADYKKAQELVAKIRQRTNTVIDFNALADIYEEAAAGLKSLGG